MPEGKPGDGNPKPGMSEDAGPVLSSEKSIIVVIG
ncbi:hypothetical protein DespoDRAFT_02752 [Desulfobacter postgatei 2ac9]|uniref:Uncharacterized protein n=1 Tax=Desulfobacter postgatei 2ac9 TaxID=879212 RepID=I5B4F4_9BACT|nr:hypothetical protein DespoDRAFT_02198 [Desulfobacter postgatei 2ac9]EIM64367.1 hypothetical protein DespoDRAFT_02521 [Desulfobacter postgatei 2ac9]EIM64581.1 hypothetical protein DespoDRAFT_02752 [Desulfobacter postgatei 2ac9]